MKKHTICESSAEKSTFLTNPWNLSAKHSLASWAIGLFALTSLAVGILHMMGVNPDNGFSPTIILIAYSSSLAAIIAVVLYYGKGGVKTLLTQILHWRVGVRWHLLVLLAPLALLTLANALYAAFGGTVNVQALFDFGALGTGMGALVAGSLGEEIGWRGFAQPLLQKRYTALMAAIIVGVIWATWHLWPILAPGGSVHIVTFDIVQTYLRLISTAVIYAWIYNSTKSLLLVMLAHAGHNIAISHIPATNNTVALLIAGMYFVAACAVVRYAGACTLRRSI